ncbi:hypothetical protein ACIBSW_26960 [Actinoplanes sp. NPDC049668]|uniref:hypothetical protein n=1 Tax=unclassified Actinoplanes TaxID=2626549 RepID=UPI0033B33FCA
MPIKPLQGGEPIPLDSPDDVAALVGHLSRGDREPAWLGTHFAYLAGTRPEWFQPYQEAVIADPRLLARLDLSFADLRVLFDGASDRGVEILYRRLRDRWSFGEAWALSAIGTDAARVAIADDVRQGGDREVYQESGIWIPPAGPAEYRFTPHRQVITLEAGSFPAADHPVGQPLDRVVRDPSTSPVSWHYLSLRLADIPGLPAWPATHAHLIGLNSWCMWTLFADVDSDGRYQGEQAVFEDETDDEIGGDPTTGRAVLRPYGPDLVYCNGHVDLTPGVVGTVGGPPLGIYPNPSCPSCKRLMFHTATVSHHIRDYGDGWRSLYLCEDCHTVAVTATGWN